MFYQITVPRYKSVWPALCLLQYVVLNKLVLFLMYFYGLLRTWVFITYIKCRLITRLRGILDNLLNLVLFLGCQKISYLIVLLPQIFSEIIQKIDLNSMYFTWRTFPVLDILVILIQYRGNIKLNVFLSFFIIFFFQHI